MRTVLVLISMMIGSVAMADEVKLVGEKAKLLFDNLEDTKSSEVLPLDYKLERRRGPGVYCEKISDMMYGDADQYTCTVQKE